MKVVVGERLDLHLLQVPTEDLVQGLTAFARGIVVGREPNDNAVRIRGGDTTRNAHGKLQLDMRHLRVAKPVSYSRRPIVRMCAMPHR